VPGTGPTVGQSRQAIMVSSSDTPPKASQMAAGPAGCRRPTKGPLATMPTPTPASITPPTRPRRAGGQATSTTGGPSTMSAPPATPESSRAMPTSQAGGSGAATMKVTAAKSSMARKVLVVPSPAASRRPPRAPAR
jgi:hypothetical protein